MSPRLETYLSLDREMRALDEVGDPLADVLRDAMDPIWLGLTDEDRRFLDQRAIAPGAPYVVRLSVNEGLFLGSFERPPVSHVPTSFPIRIENWRCAA